MELYTSQNIVFDPKIPRSKRVSIFIPFDQLLPHERDNMIGRGFQKSIFNNKSLFARFSLSREEVNHRFPNRHTDPDGNIFANDRFTLCTIDSTPGYCEDYLDYYGGQYASIGTRNYITEDRYCNDNSDDYLPGYHDQMPRWRIGNNKGQLIGIELEVEAKDNYKRNQLMNYIQSELTSSYAIIEHDGSLCDETGAEIVFRPMTLKELNDGKLEGVFKKVSTYCHSLLQPEGYGMHCNLSNEWFDGELHILKFSHLMHNSKKMTKRIALRDNASPFMPNIKLTQKATLGKYSVVNIQQKRCEVRAFRGSLHWGRFQLHIQYCLAMIDYSRNNSIQDLVPEKFVEWLSKQTNKSDYKLLGWFMCPNEYRSIKGQNKFWKTPRAIATTPISLK